MEGPVQRMFKRGPPPLASDFGGVQIMPAVGLKVYKEDLLLATCGPLVWSLVIMDERSPRLSEVRGSPSRGYRGSSAMCKVHTWTI